MRFKRGGGRIKKKEWKWKGRQMEEVKEFLYLGYKLQRNGGQEGQIKERIRKAAVVMGQVWGLGKEGLERTGEEDYGYSISWYGQF